MAEVEVLQPGLYSTIQDLGRNGFMEFGVPVSGAMDSYASGMANLLLQNTSGAAVLEITQMGPSLKFSEATQIAISGGFLSPAINGEEIENNKVYKIANGAILSFGKRILGCRAYLAVKNGFKTENVLQSRSWFKGITSHFRLEKGIKLTYEPFPEQKEVINAVVKPDDYINSEEIAAYPGPEYHLLREEDKNVLQKCPFSIGSNNNRMGIQFQEELKNKLEPILTGPVIPGTVQLTPSGKLIALMRDGQTTGGYPRVLQLSEQGINTLAQKVQGEKVNFLLIQE